MCPLMLQWKFSNVRSRWEIWVCTHSVELCEEFSRVVLIWNPQEPFRGAAAQALPLMLHLGETTLCTSCGARPWSSAAGMHTPASIKSFPVQLCMLFLETETGLTWDRKQNCLTCLWHELLLKPFSPWLGTQDRSTWPQRWQHHPDWDPLRYHNSGSQLGYHQIQNSYGGLLWIWKGWESLV